MLKRHWISMAILASALIASTAACASFCWTGRACVTTEYMTINDIPAIVADKPLALNKWACDLINSQPDNPGGCYDWCVAHAEYVDNHGHAKHDGKVYTNSGWQGTPTELPTSYSPELQNACAIVLHGAEY